MFLLSQKLHGCARTGNQIAEKYKREYENSLVLIRKERGRFISELKTIEELRVIPSQANYVMMELKGRITARELARILLEKYNILVKELSSKLSDRQYLRVAIRNTEDNNKLLAVLRKEIK